MLKRTFVKTLNGCILKCGSMFHTEFFWEKINDFPRTFQGLKSFFQGLLFANNMK